jgi:glycopeptide antibiotics resistance protein
VTQNPTAHRILESASESWSDRILVAALIGIFFLTLFPFRFVSHAKLPGGASPFLLGKSMGKHPGDLFDDFLNVLLFVPFGFGLSEKLLERRISRTTTFFIVWIAGWALSYGIEFTQQYIPGRDSGWEDIFTNSSGAALGFLLFVTIGVALLRFVTRAERAMESFITLGRLGVILLIYFSCWFALSARLQTETRLADWRPDSRLLVGSDAVGRPAAEGGPGAQWNGQLSKLEIWDRALPQKVALSLTGGAASHVAAPEPLAAYDFTSGPPFADSMKALPDLSWEVDVQGHGEPNRLVLDKGKSLMLTAPVPGLVSRLRRTDQFAVHIVGKPTQGDGWDGQIVSISPAPTMTNLTLRQEGTSLGFWFRNPLSARYAQLAWYIPGIFLANRVRNILYSYDGSSLSLYMDGKVAARPYRLGPGAALAHMVHRIKTNELDGYRDIYYAFVFFPAGVALGIAARGALDGAAARLWTALLLIVPAVLLEVLLVSVSRRAFSPGSLLFSVALAVGGALWINADGAARAAAAAE